MEDPSDNNATATYRLNSAYRAVIIQIIITMFEVPFGRYLAVTNEQYLFPDTVFLILHLCLLYRSIKLIEMHLIGLIPAADQWESLCIATIIWMFQIISGTIFDSIVSEHPHLAFHLFTRITPIIIQLGIIITVFIVYRIHRPTQGRDQPDQSAQYYFISYDGENVPAPGTSSKVPA